MNHWDYVIVGGGSAGSVLAARLSTDIHIRVLLLEAGAEDGPELMRVPPAWPLLIGSDVDWGFHTEPQAGLDGRTLPYPRGKVVGGSSAVNAMAHLRPHPSVFDSWVEQGALGWSAAELLPYFNRSERSAFHRAGNRGNAGPVQVAVPSTPNPVAVAGLDAFRQAGVPVVEDISVATGDGVSFQEMTIVNGRRQTASDAYLTPLGARPNLEVITGAMVRKLRFDGTRCVGVDYRLDGRDVQVAADREVILASGTIGSAQLLMVSGVGPRADLEAVGVDVRIDLPGVGKNLQDHPLVGVVYAARQEVPPTPYNHSDVVAVETLQPDGSSPDVQMLVLDIPFAPPTFVSPEAAYTLAFTILKPESRGAVRLRSADIADSPAVDPALLREEADMQAMLTAFRRVREIGAEEALSAWRDREVFPGDAVKTEEDERAWLRGATGSYFHPVGTCRMGTDPDAVVDSVLRVRGIDGLRVVDASVMPTIVPSNPNATVLAIAERAADLILGQ